MSQTSYSDRLKHPKWQKRRLDILNRAGFKCEDCGSEDETLHIHHSYYLKGQPWEYPDDALKALCEYCHDSTADMQQWILRVLRPVSAQDLNWIGHLLEHLVKHHSLEIGEALQDMHHSLLKREEWSRISAAHAFLRMAPGIRSKLASGEWGFDSLTARITELITRVVNSTRATANV